MAPFGILFAIVFIIPCCVSPFGFFLGRVYAQTSVPNELLEHSGRFSASQREDSSTRWKVLGSTGVFGSPDSSTDWRNWDSEVAVSGRISPLTGRIGLLMGLSAG